MMSLVQAVDYNLFLIISIYFNLYFLYFQIHRKII